MLVKLDSQRQAENLLKIKNYHNSKCKTYANERLNISNGVIRSRELVLATEEEMAAALGKQGVTNIRRVNIKKGSEKVETNTYILTFNQPQIPSGENRLLSEIWTPQGCLQRTTDMCQVQGKRIKSQKKGMLETN